MLANSGANDNNIESPKLSNDYNITLTPPSDLNFTIISQNIVDLNITFVPNNTITYPNYTIVTNISITYPPDFTYPNYTIVPNFTITFPPDITYPNNMVVPNITIIFPLNFTYPDITIIYNNTLLPNPESGSSESNDVETNTDETDNHDDINLEIKFVPIDIILIILGISFVFGGFIALQVVKKRRNPQKYIEF